ncbi:MFS transporter [Streptomyces sp. DT20]|uniref:MFS transporter n=1 Tax=unclassified Streptomyces TaxID=2593676 RepID=UPI000A80D1C6|nr:MULTISPECIES: MFS transporter [unclassified Streptomyces]WRZ10606.1 MFS transporter [Streptomyces sp. NBC_00341]
MTDTRAAAPSTPAAALRPTPPVAVIASVALVELSSGVTQGFLSPLLQRLTGTLHVTAADLNWLSICNLLASVAFTPVLSRMGDLYGHRRILRWTLAIVLTGSLIVGMSTSFRMLLVGQVLQGAFAGFFPLLVGILRNRTSDGESRRGISLMVAALVGGLAVGLLASGLIAQYVAQPTAALWVPAVGVGVALIVTWPLLPESDHRPGGSVDWLGGVVLSAGLVAIMLGLGKGGTPGWAWNSAATLGCLAGGVVLTALFARIELRSDEPMIDVRLFAHGDVVVISLIALTFSFCMIGLQVANPVFLSTPESALGYGLGLTPLRTAFAMLPYMGAVAAGSLTAPALAGRFGDRLTLVAGSLLMAAGYAGALLTHQSLWPFLVTTLVSGAGCGFLQQSTRTLAVELVPHDQTSVGSGINELLINVGGSLGAAAVLAISAKATPAGSPLPRLGAYTTSWTVCIGVSLLGAVIALFLRRSPAKH